MSETIINQPWSVARSAHMKVQWAFIAVVALPPSPSHRLRFCRWYLNHASKFILIILWHIRKECFKKKKKRLRMGEWEKKNFPSLNHRKINAIILKCVSERVSTLNCPLVIDLTHIVYCYLFSFSLCASRSHKFIPKNAWNTHTHKGCEVIISRQQTSWTWFFWIMCTVQWICVYVLKCASTTSRGFNEP